MQVINRRGGRYGFVVIGVCGGVSAMAQIRVWVDQWWVTWLFGGWIEVLWWVLVARLKFGDEFQWLRLEFGGGFQWWHKSEFGGGICSQIGVWWWVLFSYRRGMAPGLAEFLFYLFFNQIWVGWFAPMGLCG